MFKQIATIAIAGFTVSILHCSAALAYSAEPGCRAANFRGYDIVNEESIELDDYLGHWVYIDFWATWCGPCMDDLPKMVEDTRPFVESGELKVITVNSDSADQLRDVKRVLRELKFPYPVIFDGGIHDTSGIGYPLPALEWGVRSFPSTFLINPQGEIVANYMWGKVDLPKVLEFYLAEPRPLMGVTGWAEVREDGTSVSIYASVMNRGREDVTLKLRASLSQLLWDENNVVYDSKDIACSPVYTPVTVSFGDYSEIIYKFEIPTQESWHSLSFALFLAVPGAENAVETKDRGYELMFSHPEIRTINLAKVDGEWIVREAEK